MRNEVPNHLNDGHHFSDSSRDVIQDIEAFLRSHSPSEYTCTNAAAVLNRALKSDRDPSELLYDARQQARFGLTYGTIQFLKEELERMHETLSQTDALARHQDAVRSSLRIVQSALETTNLCLMHLHALKVRLACEDLRATREHLHNLQILSPLDGQTDSTARILHATALAWDLLSCAAGK
ncbi:MAG TPA: hypothetical protein VFB21_23975 [Chthonomonadaceae bacterium]|nr:hypothetical protein [Chthonomonadaceae bacterium]